jgi:hypothetical protein
MLMIKWHEGYAKGTTDLLPLYWIEKDGTDGFRQHAMRNVDDPKIYARCSVTVKGHIVALDYSGEHRVYNEAHEYLPGVMRLTFEDDSRTGKPGVEWKDEGSDEFEDENSIVTITRKKVPIKNFPPFDPKNLKDGRTKIKRLVAIRQGQSEFRDSLMAAYGGQCAITGCRVEEVLEAAHIMPYLDDKQTNHVTNGLILRADIHTLFDLDIIRVEPDYRISATVSVVKAFNLPDRLTNLPKVEALRPSPDALNAKWAT